VAVKPGRTLLQDEQGRLEAGQMVIDLPKIKLAINNFRPFKSAGTDDIVPALLQNGVEHIASYL
jgi:hypothetical protein